ncbi:MAG: hypothetical protein WDW38_009378 [Sanguina aurantia]
MAPPTTPTASSGFDVQGKVEVLREDLSHLFDQQGINAAEYEDVVDFCDPITKFSSLSGYLSNIRMLKTAFNPTFILHDIKPADATSVITRWTMVMELTAVRALPLLSKYWSPTIVFSGTSIYVYNPASNRICRHIDTWDSIQNQEYFSLEGFADFLKQLFVLHKPPAGLETPPYTILKRFKDYEVRSYPSFIVAQCAMDSGAGGGSAPGVNPAGPGTLAFNKLAGYIFGKNDRGQRMSMTTPVFSSSGGTMQFVIPPSTAKDTSLLPAPLDSTVVAREEAGGVLAVRIFSGLATEESAVQEEAQLRASLVRDGQQLQEGAPWQLARYNDPSTPAPLRRNEVLIPLDDFQLW